MKYIILHMNVDFGRADKTLIQFTELVNGYMGEGWSPQGGVALDTRATATVGFFQAMIKDSGKS